MDLTRYEKGRGGGGGGGGNSLQVRYEKWGAVHFRSDIRKVGGGGGRQFASGPIRKVGDSDVSSPIGVWGFASRDPHHISGP